MDPLFDVVSVLWACLEKKITNIFLQEDGEEECLFLFYEALSVWYWFFFVSLSIPLGVHSLSILCIISDAAFSYLFSLHRDKGFSLWWSHTLRKGIMRRRREGWNQNLSSLQRDSNLRNYNQTDGSDWIYRMMVGWWSGRRGVFPTPLRSSLHVTDFPTGWVSLRYMGDWLRDKIFNPSPGRSLKKNGDGGRKDRRENDTPRY